MTLSYKNNPAAAATASKCASSAAALRCAVHTGSDCLPIEHPPPCAVRTALISARTQGLPSVRLHQLTRCVPFRYASATDNGGVFMMVWGSND